MFRHCRVVMKDFQKSVTKPPKSKKSEINEFWTFRRFKQKRDINPQKQFLFLGRQKSLISERILRRILWVW
jgi:hypothetical protein